MKENDLVMFTDEGTYAKWFYGKLAIVKSVSIVSDTYKPNKQVMHCRVEWINPVKYFHTFTKSSDFSADKFTVQQSN